MNLVFKNIFSFLKYEKFVFVIMLLCVFVTALILNFSYGLYQNYNAQKYESEVNLKEIYIEIEDNAVLTRNMLECYYNNIKTKTLNKMDIIYCAAEIPPYDSNYYGLVQFRFCIKNGEYCISQNVKNIWEKQGLISSGRFFSDDEEKNGKDVAIVFNNGNGWNEPTQNIKSSENSIELFGRPFQVIGETSVPGTPIIPFLSVPEDTRFTGIIAFAFSSNINKTIYDELKSAAETAIPGVLVFEEIEFPDNEAIYMYNNIMLISVLIAILSVINFAMLYHFILQERSRDIAIFRICGCNALKTMMICLGECFILSVPIYIIGAISYYNIMHHILANIFPYMEAAYSTIIYVAIFLIYFIIMLIILAIMIYKHVKKSIIEEWKGGGR